MKTANLEDAKDILNLIMNELNNNEMNVDIKRLSEIKSKTNEIILKAKELRTLCNQKANRMYGTKI